jgi:Bacterial sugar transferase
VDSVFFRDLRRRRLEEIVHGAIKRGLDIAGSLTLLVVLSPLLLLIAALVRWSSPGTVLFRQIRIGKMTKPFTMLKFRTMYTGADHRLHREFVGSFIKASSSVDQPGRTGFFKLTNDPRITRVGRLLRSMSLDELPQLWKRATRRYVAGRAATSVTVRSRAVRALASPTDPGDEAGNHGTLAGGRSEPDHLRRDGAPGPAVREETLPVERHQDPPGDARGGDLEEGGLLRRPPERSERGGSGIIADGCDAECGDLSGTRVCEEHEDRVTARRRQRPVEAEEVIDRDNWPRNRGAAVERDGV